MLRFLLVVAIVVAAVLLVRWFLNEDPKKLAGILRRGGLWLAAGLLVVLAMTGRLHWLFAVIGAAMPFMMRILSLLRFVPLLGQLYTYYQNAQARRSAASGPSGGGASQVQAKYLRMTLDHDSGQMDGEVLVGKHRGTNLSELDLVQLLELLDQARADDRDSAALLEAYLDRVHGEDWREQSGTSAREEHAPSGKMSEHEAREILGVAGAAQREEIIEAHRRLMQKIHPDRGGSTYLAAKINQAKAVLLDAL